MSISGKRAIITRLGAFGDGIMMTPALRALKRDGYHVTAHVSDRVAQVIRGNPHVDKVIIAPHEVKNVKEYCAQVEEGYDRAINLSGSIEGALLAVEGTPEYHLTHEERHRRYNKNYYDHTMEVCGYPELTGQTGELYFTYYEKSCGRQMRKKAKRRFLILWALSGSSFHKAYPYTELVAREFLDRHEDSCMITVGDVFCKILEWEHPRVKHCSDEWSIRRSLLGTMIADLVIGTETGVLNAAGCFDTPKIALLSHSSKENLTKYFKNCISLYAKDCACYPCHRLIYTRDACPMDHATGATKCMAGIDPETVLNAMEDTYAVWKESRKTYRSANA